MRYAEKLTTKTTLDADDRLILVRVKVERAKKHLTDLAAEVLALEHVTIVSPDPDTRVAPHPKTFLWDKDAKRVPSLTFDTVAIAGDIVHNLRAALDHLAKQLVLVGLNVIQPTITLTDQEVRLIEFPIAETLAKYESGKARKVKGMTPEAVKAIDRLKPYKGGNDALWRIHELDNIDKHRSLFTIAHDFLFVADWLDGAYLLKAENPNFVGVEPDVEKDIQAEIEKPISQAEIAQPNALLPSLHQLVDFVDGLVLSFKPLLG